MKKVLMLAVLLVGLGLGVSKAQADNADKIYIIIHMDDEINCEASRQCGGIGDFIADAIFHVGLGGWPYYGNPWVAYYDTSPTINCIYIPIDNADELSESVWEEIDCSVNTAPTGNIEVWDVAVQGTLPYAED